MSAELRWVEWLLRFGASIVHQLQRGRDREDLIRAIERDPRGVDTSRDAEIERRTRG